MKTALLLGRFQAVTTEQARWISALGTVEIDRVVCVITSADHSGTKRNPLPVEAREKLLTPLLQKTGKPFDLVPINDIAESGQWVQHVLDAVKAKTGHAFLPGEVEVFSSNHDVQTLFGAAGFSIVSAGTRGITPQELIAKIVEGKDWKSDASDETVTTYAAVGMQTTLRKIFGEAVLTADGELGHQRDFDSYGAQMDASLRQKLEDLVRWVVPGCIVDKGCGTGKLMVELSRLFPDSRLVGVDLSREFLRRCDENTYSTEDVGFVFGNVIDQNVSTGTASTVIYSSVMHEVHSYTGYNREEIHRALTNCFEELRPGGNVLIRDGISPLPATWRLTFLNEATRECFLRFAREFRHGAGAKFTQLTPMQVSLSSHDANEFLCKKDYQKNWHIEIHEEFGAFTLPEWSAALVRAGFQPLYLTEYVNEWIVKNRYEGSAALHDAEGHVLPWPATNCVVVGRKPRS